MAETFAAAGASVAVVARERSALDETLAALQSANPNAAHAAISADVREAAEVARAHAEAVAACGPIDILVNNSGTSNAKPFLEIDDDDWQDDFDLKLFSAVRLCRLCLPHMRGQGWGRIIGVTTSFETMHRKGGAPYGPAKAGHEALMSTIAKELEGTGVTANVLVPGGPTNTAMIPDDTPFDREALIQPGVMRGPVVWLASEASDGVNGRRVIGHLWDDQLPLGERIEKASVPVAWPNLRRSYVAPGT